MEENETLESPSRVLTPKEITAELDKYIIGQAEAKRSVAIALRNRWRRQQVQSSLRDEIAPKNIIMIGPTGVGKTEIARRLARLANSPFLKVEATKFTEVGYVGRDVESMVRDLTELAVNMAKKEEQKKVVEKADELAEERLLDILLPKKKEEETKEEDDDKETVLEVVRPEKPESKTTREKLRRMMRDGKLDERYVELETSANRGTPMIEIFSSSGLEEMEFNMKEAFGSIFPGKKKKRRVKVHEALEILSQEEIQKLIDMDKVIEEAVRITEQNGIIFLDELDKIAGSESTHGPDVSREGVQRDLIPIVEGSTVATKYGMVKTDHILFIAAGAFNVSKPSDLLPELQGRFPIRVELDSLTSDDFVRILTEPRNALIKQYKALLETEGVELVFEDSAIKEIASMSGMVNERMEDIGARRLHTILEKLLDEVSFDAPDLTDKKVVIDDKYVKERLDDILEDENLSQYIL